MDVRLFEYFGELGKLLKRLLASRALSGWKDINVQPRNPEFSKDHIFTEDVIGAMVLHAYGEHLHEMGKLRLIIPKVNSTLTCDPMNSYKLRTSSRKADRGRENSPGHRSDVVRRDISGFVWCAALVTVFGTIASSSRSIVGGGHKGGSRNWKDASSGPGCFAGPIFNHIEAMENDEYHGDNCFQQCSRVILE